MQGRGIEQDLISYVGQLEFTNVPIEEWTIDPDVHHPFDSPCNVMHLPTHYGKNVHTSVMTCCTSKVIDGGRGSKIFPEPFSIGPCRFHYVFLITLQAITLVPVDYSASLCYVFPVLGDLKEVPDGVSSP